MMDYKYGTNTIFEINLHVAWVTKHRKTVLNESVGVRLRALLKEICQQEQVAIIKGRIGKDYVHLLVSISPQIVIANLVQKLRGSSYRLLAEFPELNQQIEGEYIWAKGYFCCSSGNVTDENIKHYISSYVDYSGDDFQVESELVLSRELSS